jgi:hypothetical protein
VATNSPLGRRARQLVVTRAPFSGDVLGQRGLPASVVVTAIRRSRPAPAIGSTNAPIASAMRCCEAAIEPELSITNRTSIAVAGARPPVVSSPSVALPGPVVGSSVSLEGVLEALSPVSASVVLSVRSPRSPGLPRSQAARERHRMGRGSIVRFMIE